MNIISKTGKFLKWEAHSKVEKKFIYFVSICLILQLSLPKDLYEKLHIVSVLLLGGLLFILLLIRELQKLNEKVEKQKILLEIKNKEMTDSIKYALHIQTAILPPLRVVQDYFKNSFILYKPKDIVSGDFYWMETKNGITFFAACDCTGHGVPGALVSMICHNALNSSINEYNLLQPSDILNKVDEIVLNNFSKSESKMHDGMDISLCAFNPKKMELQWAGANNPLWLVKDGALIEFIANKQSIGNNETTHQFVNHQIQIETESCVYIFSDGYADQFGAAGGKKLTKKRFKELLLSIHKLPMNEQKTELEKFISNYKLDEDQTDDILVMGVRLSS